MADEGAAEIEPAIDSQSCMRFDLLSEEFGQDDLLGEIF
jgi:hypothetical protein